MAIAAVVLALVSGTAWGQERVHVWPDRVTLASGRDFRQLVVTGDFGGEARDLTGQARVSSTNPRVAATEGSRVRAVGDGVAAIRVRVAGRTLLVPVQVTRARAPDPVRFGFEAVPVLTKYGCASGSCHGSPHGKGGFSLSLFGYDPRRDRVALTRDGYHRRVNLLEPTRSLVLRKPLLELPHVGGRRFRRDETGYRVLARWIAEGASTALPEVAVDRIEVYPGDARVLRKGNPKQQLAVVAHYSDGTRRDVTAIATYETSHPAVVSVGADGLVTGKARGFAAVSVRYLDKLESIDFTVVEDVPGFVWSAPAENNGIDTLVNARLRQLQYRPTATCSDAVFLRRVSLDLTGLLPSPERTRRFLADRSPKKRAVLVDELLASEEFARFWALQIADLMRVSPRRLPGGQAERLARFLVDSVRANQPYDDFARQVLTSAGTSEQSPATAYFVAIPTSEERTEMTAQVFLGSRVECARCHNHPFENWTQRDYYRIAAVFARTVAAGDEVATVGVGEGVHPATGERLAPWATPSGAPEPPDRRATFAHWLTAPGNPLFARVAVNRIWAALLGRGIVEPVDDFRSSNPPSNGPLLDYLARTFEKSGYDRKALIRRICNSQTYQRTPRSGRSPAGDDTLFSQTRVRLLSAEQLQDALGTASRTLPPPAMRAGQVDEATKALRAREAALADTFARWETEKESVVAALPLWQGAWRLNRVERPDWPDDGEVAFVAPPGIFTLSRTIHAAAPRTVTLAGRLPGVTLWVNDRQVGSGEIHGDFEQRVDLPAGRSQVVLRSGGQAPGGFRFLWRLVEEKRDHRLPSWALEDLATPKPLRRLRPGPGLVGAFLQEEGSAPALKRHLAALEERLDYATQRPFPALTEFTTTFGQPVRETACTCERRQAPTLLQALELLNGKTAFAQVQAGASGYAALGDDSLVEEAYLAALCRFPTTAERMASRRFLARPGRREDVVADFLWTLFNTQEFLFQH